MSSIHHQIKAQAFDEIAALIECETWELPFQVVARVRALKEHRDAFDEGSFDICPCCGHEKEGDVGVLLPGVEASEDEP